VKCIETHEQQNSEKKTYHLSLRHPSNCKNEPPLVHLVFLISWYLEGKEYCTILKSTFSFLAGKADTNVMKTCVLHINERLKEGNSQEQRFVVVVPKKKAKLTQNIIPIAYEVMICLFEFSV